MRRIVCNVKDFKDSSGKWVHSCCPVPNERHFTRAGVLWNNITKRCKVGGDFQKKNPSYINTINGFLDFQEFTEWCQDQYGYLHNDPNGRYWSLDKDLIEYGNLEYSRDKCIFIPHRTNLLLIARGNDRGEYPLGVYWDKNAEKFRAKCNNGRGKTKHLGLFTDPFEAHKAWQQYKIQVMQQILKEDEEVKLHTKLIPIIESHIQRISDDLASNRETI